MNFRELNENGEVVNFADQAEQTLNKVGALAKSAYGKFKSAKDKAVSDIKQDQKQAEADAKAKSAEDTKNKKDAMAAKASTKSAPITVAGILLDRTPEETDLPEFDDLDAEHFQNVQTALEQTQLRFEKFNKQFVRVMKAAPFINAADRNNVPERLGDQEGKLLESAETMLMQDKFGERNAWMLALTKDDPSLGSKALINMIGEINKRHEKLNQAQDQKVYATGLNLINVLGAQRQIIEMRIGLLRAALDKLSQKPAMTEALLKRVKKLSKRLST